MRKSLVLLTDFRVIKIGDEYGVEQKIKHRFLFWTWTKWHTVEATSSGVCPSWYPVKFYFYTDARAFAVQEQTKLNNQRAVKRIVFGLRKQRKCRKRNQ